MDKIEKIKEWVKKQKKEELARNSIGVITGKALFVDADELLSFLDTLSEEPDKEDLNDEIKKFIEEYGYERGGDKLLIAIVARHFAGWGAEWQKSQMMKDGNVILAEEDFDAEKEKSMEWGYNLCKEQMLKEAVEGYVAQRAHGNLYAKAQVPDEMNLEFGDKVRIIVLKAEEE